MEIENLTIDEFLEKRILEKIERERLEQERILKENLTPLQIKNYLHLNKNIKNLNFEKRFFTQEDAKFLTKQIDKFEEENSIWEPIELSEEDVNNWLDTLTLSGVRYDFKNLGVTIYTTWQFDQVIYANHASNIDYGHIAYYYNHYTEEFREINNEDFFDVDFSVCASKR